MLDDDDHFLTLAHTRKGRTVSKETTNRLAHRVVVTVTSLPMLD